MHLFFSVGEPSGDQHAARLIRELQSNLPKLRVSGFCGPRMEAAGCECHFRLTDLAVMGFFRVLPMLRQFWSLLTRADRILRDERPDAVVLVDFPGFNWWIARKAKRLGIPVFYYLPPQLWAWAPWRIGRIRRHVDHVLCGLSFEQRWYQARGVDADFVGHPFFDEVAEHSLNDEFLTVAGSWDGRVVGLLPGSRRHEVEQNWPVMVAVMRIVAARHPETRFMVACFSEEHRQFCVAHLRQQTDFPLKVKLFVGRTPEVIEVAECCLMVSGSVSLEMLARRTPAIVIYYTTPATWLLLRALVTCRFASLPNLMADREILPEYFPRGDGADVARQVADHLSCWLEDDAELSRVRAELSQLRAEVGHAGAIRRAAEVITRRLAERHARAA